jgi:ABC-type transport system involved in cytochrome bd biosynthesis fused ATPase/permease subunit
MGRMWTRAMETGSEAVASSTRIDQFLKLGVDAAAHSMDISQKEERASMSSDILVRVDRSSYTYANKETTVLSNIELCVSKGELIIVVGAVGSV